MDCLIVNFTRFLLLMVFTVQHYFIINGVVLNDATFMVVNDAINVTDVVIANDAIVIITANDVIKDIMDDVIDDVIGDVIAEVIDVINGDDDFN